MSNLLTWVEVEKKALLQNISSLRKLIGPKVKLLAVVKGNSYGHGICKVAKVIENKADWFGVNNLGEALILKREGIKKPILILGYTPTADLLQVVKNDFRQVVYSRQTAIQLAKLLRYRPKVHLKIETGTNRQGVEDDELLAIAKILTKYPKVKIEGACTHFANVEESEDFSFPKKQIDRFRKQLEILEENGMKISIKHTACTAASILFPQSCFNMVRVGIGMYGLWPSKITKNLAKKKGIKLELKPVLSWKTKAAQIKKVKKGETIGYGRSFKTKRDLKIAILPVGYYDGFDRHLSNVGRVLIRGKFGPIVGRVMMNMTIVDVTNIPNVKTDDEVVLIGRQGRNEITAEEMAEKIGTINYEVVTRINPLLSRIPK